MLKHTTIYSAIILKYILQNIILQIGHLLTFKNGYIKLLPVNQILGQIKPKKTKQNKKNKKK
jgi:hypothetical protein